MVALPRVRAPKAFGITGKPVLRNLARTGKKKSLDISISDFRPFPAFSGVKIL